MNEAEDLVDEGGESDFEDELIEAEESDPEDDEGGNDHHEDVAREQARVRKHEIWLEEGRNDLQDQLLHILRPEASLCITRQLLMLLTLEPHRLASLRQTLHHLPPGTALHELTLQFFPSDSDRDCRNPPSEEALLMTATALAHMMSNIDSLRRLHLNNAPASIASLFLRTRSLRQLYIQNIDFSDSESINAFCLGMETSSLELLLLFGVAFSPEHEAQVARTLASCKTLVNFDYPIGANPSFCEHYCAALSNNVDTKLERLLLFGQSVLLNLHGENGQASGLDTTTMADIRLLLGLNVQRKTYGPLFAAIGVAETDAARRQCLVKAFLAAACPLTFECIRSNQCNLISLIQQLGRSETVR